MSSPSRSMFIVVIMGIGCVKVACTAQALASKARQAEAEGCDLGSNGSSSVRGSKVSRASCTKSVAHTLLALCGARYAAGGILLMLLFAHPAICRRGLVRSRAPMLTSEPNNQGPQRTCQGHNGRNNSWCVRN